MDSDPTKCAARLEIIPSPERGVIVLRLSDSSSGALGHINLTADMVERTFAQLLASWRMMDKNAGVPGAPGTWMNTPALEDPAWTVGARPLDGAITLSLCPARVEGRELWLTYAFQRGQAETLTQVLGLALARPTFEGSA